MVACALSRFLVSQRMSEESRRASMQILRTLRHWRIFVANSQVLWKRWQASCHGFGTWTRTASATTNWWRGEFFHLYQWHEIENAVLAMAYQISTSRIARGSEDCDFENTQRWAQCHGRWTLRNNRGIWQDNSLSFDFINWWRHPGHGFAMSRFRQHWWIYLPSRLGAKALRKACSRNNSCLCVPQSLSHTACYLWRSWWPRWSWLDWYVSFTGNLHNGDWGSI